MKSAGVPVYSMVKRYIDCNECCICAALVVHCVDCIVKENLILYARAVPTKLDILYFLHVYKFT
jgi:hypothetical protein